MRTGKSKFSLLDRRMNVLLVFLLFAQQVVCGLFALFAALFNNDWALSSFYLLPLNTQLANADFVARTWITFFILLNLVIPMSLFVSLEFIKIFQAKLMEADLQMSEMRDDHWVHMIAKTSNLNQELSQLDMIFSDKTGTLTCNKMEFKKAWVNGVVYNEEKISGSMLVFLREHAHEQEKSIEQHKFMLKEFCMCILLNNAVVPEIVDTRTGERSYSGPSADEVALLKCIRVNGFHLLERTNKGVLVEVLGKRQFYEILASLEFSSERKRSSVIVRDPQGQIMLYTKGADTIMFPRAANRHIIEPMSEALIQFSTEGLRTLVMGCKQLSEQEYSEWAVRYQEASESLVNRRYLVGTVSNELERQLLLVGCTGIEDKLQENVPESIDFLLKAGFQVWVLTGDKTETAINIAYSANVLHKENVELRITDPINKRHCQEKFEIARQVIVKNAKKNVEYALIIDTKALKHALTPELEALFIGIVKQCKSAVCCRCTPLQKAKVTRLVERRLKKKALAIGDGVNDVSMIQSCSK
jgi:phospholipid-transporting ATPase